MLKNGLKIGDQGDDVIELQRLLIGWGDGESPVIMDGIFGHHTNDAVMNFQKAHNIEPYSEINKATMDAIYKEPERHPFPFEQYLCTCGKCDGFGNGRYKNEYRPAMPKKEEYYKYEYPGLDRTLFWAVLALMHKASLKRIQITSGYRCWYWNEAHNSVTTNHLGKAIDFIGFGGGIHNGDKYAKIECTECKRVREVGVLDCGFQAGWKYNNRISFEMPEQGAYTWVHIDSRMIPVELRQHVKTVKELKTRKIDGLIRNC